jgi:hypothetical protein
MTKNETNTTDTKLLRWVVMAGMSFSAIEYPEFLDFVQSLRMSYQPCGTWGSALCHNGGVGVA